MQHEAEGGGARGIRVVVSVVSGHNIEHGEREHCKLVTDSAGASPFFPSSSSSLNFSFYALRFFLTFLHAYNSLGIRPCSALLTTSIDFAGASFFFSLHPPL